MKNSSKKKMLQSNERRLDLVEKKIKDHHIVYKCVNPPYSLLYPFVQVNEANAPIINQTSSIWKTIANAWFDSAAGANLGPYMRDSCMLMEVLDPQITLPKWAQLADAGPNVNNIVGQIENLKDSQTCAVSSCSIQYRFTFAALYKGSQIPAAFPNLVDFTAIVNNDNNRIRVFERPLRLRRFLISFDNPPSALEKQFMCRALPQYNQTYKDINKSFVHRVPNNTIVKFSILSDKRKKYHWRTRQNVRTGQDLQGNFTMEQTMQTYKYISCQEKVNVPLKKNFRFKFTGIGYHWVSEADHNVHPENWNIYVAFTFETPEAVKFLCHPYNAVAVPAGVMSGVSNAIDLITTSYIQVLS